MKNTNNSGLIIAIVFASIVIAGSLIFFGLQSKNQNNPQPTNLDDSIAKGIDGYIKKQQQVAKNAQKQEKKKQQSSWDNLVKPNSEDHVRGNPNAKISIIEYSDYECPFCKRFHLTMKDVLAEYGNQVNWIYRNFPLDFHSPIADAEAEATECVADLGGNKKYWEFSDLIFATTKSNKGLDIKKLPNMAENIGINKNDFQKCMDDNKFSAKIKQQIQDGAKAGVRGTPGSFILNNETGEIQFINGAQPLNNIKSVIDSLL